MSTFQMNKVTTSMIKYSYGYNYYGLRDAMINNDMVEAHYPRCNQVEIQSRITTYSVVKNE